MGAEDKEVTEHNNPSRFVSAMIGTKRRIIIILGFLFTTVSLVEMVIFQCLCDYSVLKKQAFNLKY